MSPIGIAEIMFVLGLMALAFWKTSYLRVILAICIIIWGVWALPYDVKIAAPLVAIGSGLFIAGIIKVMGWEPRWGEG